MAIARASSPRRSVEQEYRYEHLTWPEINDAVAMKKVVVLPVGSTEQHGHHLPLDVDAKLSSSVVYEAARRAPADMLVLPPVAYGYCHHVMDFPGTINIEPSTFVKFLLDITRSVAYHGFKRIVVVNGHGSNHPLVEEIGRQTILQTDALCLTLSWWQLVAERWNREWRESVLPGGCAHACELETSMYQHVDPAGVRAQEIRDELAAFMALPGAARWHTVDLTASSPAAIVEWTSTYTQSGVIGEAKKATPEKGREVFEHAVGQLVEMVRWFRTRPRPERHDHHAAAPTFALPFGW
ncbi:MAG TPA: creatininase family protein [bacterium]|nr:creatininase family protein [bacterium]